MIRSITKTKKSSYAQSESEIQGYYYYCNEDTSQYYYAEKKKMRELHQEGDRYFSIGRNSTPEAFWRASVNNEWFLQTEPNSTEEDNLLNLPDYEE